MLLNRVAPDATERGESRTEGLFRRQVGRRRIWPEAPTPERREWETQVRGAMSAANIDSKEAV